MQKTKSFWINKAADFLQEMKIDHNEYQISNLAENLKKLYNSAIAEEHAHQENIRRHSSKGLW
jgi:hypothetical protein